MYRPDNAAVASEPNAQAAHHPVSSAAADGDPFDRSLWGEYVRMLLVGTAACSGIVWATRLATEPAALMMVLANLSIMAIAVGKCFEGLRRLIVSSLFVLGITATLLASGDTIAWRHPLPIFSPAVTIAALIVLVVRDGLITIRTLPRGTSPQTVVVAAVVLAVSTYMVVIPVTDALLETFRERPQSYTIEELSAFEVFRIRSAKLAVFAIFAYAGACVGSFLNVVAASAPRGEPIALRSSACPKCGTPIRRIDNLPIISYLRLRGRCRDCDAVIPIRYFVVELAGFAIFATLFLYQLISGAANVPGFRQYHYAGILWIILYTKWPVIGIYFFHCALFSCVLMLALMEQDRLRPPRRMAFALPSVFALLAIVSPALLTVSLGDQTPWGFPATLPDWLDRAATCAAGAALGGVVARLAEPMRLRHRQSSASLAPALVLLGISLGWQAAVTIAVLWFAAMTILKLVRWATDASTVADGDDSPFCGRDAASPRLEMAVWPSFVLRIRLRDRRMPWTMVTFCSAKVPGNAAFAEPRRPFETEPTSDVNKCV